MTRTRIVEDYESKKQAILDTAADLFSRVGYANVKMADIAAACGGSKSMLYHYFRKKDDVLFAMLKEYMEDLTTGFEAIVSNSAPPEEKFRRFIKEYVDKSREARTRNVVTLYDVRFLTKRHRSTIVDMERHVLDLVIDLLRSINPSLDRSRYKPYGLLLFGMLNLTDTWYNPRGPIRPDELCERISGLFLHGFVDET